MIPTILDLKTGQTKRCNDWDNSVFWWAEGNGSCDCNRAIAIGGENLNENTCDGCRRYLIIDVEGDLEGDSKAEIIRLANSEYYHTLDKSQ